MGGLAGRDRGVHCFREGVLDRPYARAAVTRPESHPEYLRHTIETFLDVMREAEALTDAGDTGGPELVELLRHAAELLDIVAEGMQGYDAGEVPLAAIDTLRAMLEKATTHLDASGTLH